MDKSHFADINAFVKSFPLANDLNNSSFLITGATGLIGSMLIRCLVALDKSIKIIAPVRNRKKAMEMFNFGESVVFFECDLEKYEYSNFGYVDYIVHCAAPTESKFFVEHPVETYKSICNITERILEFARIQGVKSVVYLSSLEVYGQVLDDKVPITEDYQGYLNPLDVRSSYPMAKRAMENLLVLYYSEYSVNAKIARLTQTTGPGVAKEDNRVIVQFTRLATTNNNIVLHTTGESARPYCYTIDAISAILYILLKGKNGEAYNVANQDTYISVRDLALLIKDIINPDIKVCFELSSRNEYAHPTKLRLSSSKLEELGWKPQYCLNAIIENLSKLI